MYTGGEYVVWKDGDIQVVVVEFKGGRLIYRKYEIQWNAGGLNNQ